MKDPELTTDSAVCILAWPCLLGQRPTLGAAAKRSLNWVLAALESPGSK